MRPPDTHAGLLALVLGALGAVFTLLGLAGQLIAIPMRAGWYLIPFPPPGTYTDRKGSTP